MERGIVHLSHRAACSHWASWYTAPLSTNGIIYSCPGEVNAESHERYPCTSHPLWCSDGPLLPCHPTFPDSHQSVLVAHSQHHLQDTIYLFLWEAHLHIFPVCYSCWHRGWGKGRNVVMPGWPQSKPCIAKHQSLHILQLTFQKSPCQQPMNVLNQVRLIFSSMGLRGKKMHMKVSEHIGHVT